MQLKSKYKKFFIFLMLALWPFIFLFPLTSNFIVMGNDFDLIYFSYKKYITELLFEGVIPLWSPSEASGMPLIFNPFTQFFYIPGWINFLIYFVKNQLTLSDYLIYTISSLSIYSIGSYLWLRELKIDFWPAFTASLIACCSLKLTEILRFPNAAHASAWFPWVLYGVTLAANFKNKAKSFLIIFFSFLFILTAGYPYFIAYSFFLFLPYTFFMSLNVTRKKLLLNNNLEIKHKPTFLKFNFLCGSSFALSTLISSPWLIKVKSFMDLTTDRTINNWEFATAHEFYWIDTLGSWFFPPAASAEGWYYFGAISSILIFFSMAIFLIEKIKDDRNKLIIACSTILFLFITYFSWGKYSLLFSWTWHNIPLIGQLRTWPRINIILVPLITLLLSVAISKYFMIFESSKSNLRFTEQHYKYLRILFLIGVIVIFFQSLFIFFNITNEEYWNFWQYKRFSYAIETLHPFWGGILKLYNGKIYMMFTLISVFTLTGILTLKNKVLIKKNYQALISIIILLIASLELFAISNIQWAIPKWKGDNNIKIMSPLNELKKAFISPRIAKTVKGNNYFRDGRKFNINYPDNYGYASHADIFSRYFSRNGDKKNNSQSEENFNLVKTFYGLDKKAKKFFFTEKKYFKNIEDFVIHSKNFEIASNINFSILMSKYTGSQVFLETNSTRDGWLSFIDNWDHDWKAYINNEPVKIYKLFNTYKSIKIQSGKSRIVFKYIPWSGNNNLSVLNKLYKTH